VRLLAGWNILKLWLLVAGFCAGLGGLGWLLGGSRLLSIFVFSGLLVVGSVYLLADRLVLGMVRARELQLGEAPAAHAALRRLARRAGVEQPKLFLIPGGHPRALAAGRGPRTATIAVSAGLLSALRPEQLEGVLAHELAHVRQRDVLLQTAAVVLGVSLIEASRLGGLPFLERALLFVLGPTAAAFVHLLLSPKRELRADRLAARLCESPHGLADALIRLEGAGELVELRASPATEPLYTINPFSHEGLEALFETHPPVGDRVRRLRALDPDWRRRLRAA